MEKINEEVLDEVISLREKEKPITKKEACEKLGIKYNTKRLDKLIEDRKNYLQKVKEMKKKLRGKPATDAEIGNIISSYINGGSLTEISKHTYRSVAFIKGILERHGVPIRANKSDYFNPIMLPDDAIKEDYEEGNIVFSARYNQVAKVLGVIQDHEFHGKVYSIMLMKENMRACQPWYELGDLTKVFDKFNLTHLVI